MTRTIRARGVLTVGALGLVLVLTGCGGADTEPTDTEPTDTVAVTAETPDETPPATGGSDVHTRLANALVEEAPLLSRQILAAKPRLEEHALPEQITGWQAFEVIREDSPNIPPAVVAINDEDRAMVLSAQPENFTVLTAGISVADAEQATALAAGFLELTRDRSRLGYPIASFDDLRWADRLNADQVAVQAQAERELADGMHGPQVSETADGWVVTSWAGDQDTIVRHETTVARDGTVSDRATTMAEALPLQRTVHGG